MDPSDYIKTYESDRKDYFPNGSISPANLEIEDIYASRIITGEARVVELQSPLSERYKSNLIPFRKEKSDSVFYDPQARFSRTVSVEFSESGLGNTIDINSQRHSWITHDSDM